MQGKRATASEVTACHPVPKVPLGLSAARYNGGNVSHGDSTRGRFSDRPEPRDAVLVCAVLLSRISHPLFFCIPSRPTCSWTNAVQRDARRGLGTCFVRVVVDRGERWASARVARNGRVRRVQVRRQRERETESERVRVEERVRCSLQTAEDRAFGLATKLAGATQSVPGRRRVVESERKNLMKRVDTGGL